MAHLWSFALYRQPGAGCKLVRDDGNSTLQLSDIGQLEGHSGFVIAPFRADRHHPIVLIKSAGPVDFPCSPVPADEVKTVLPHTVPTATYQQSFGLFSEALHRRQFDKLVLSRPYPTPLPEGFSLRRAFETACARYTHSCVYLFYTPQTGLWLGASPEILLAGDTNGYRTIALAGTQPIINGKLPEEWNEKNRLEQQLVTAYLRNALAQSGIRATEKGPFPAQAGALSHLKTELSFHLPADVSPTHLLQDLHPTPAVCGLPKQEALDFILAHEGYDRGYYSGFLGWFDSRKHTDIYVNLRCMHLEKEQCTLYAGGGLLPDSTLEEEWQETERKLQTMSYVVRSGQECTATLHP